MELTANLHAIPAEYSFFAIIVEALRLWFSSDQRKIPI